jgi:hypothetical protein
VTSTRSMRSVVTFCVFMIAPPSAGRRGSRQPGLDNLCAFLLVASFPGMWPNIMPVNTYWVIMLQVQTLLEQMVRNQPATAHSTYFCRTCDQVPHTLYTLQQSRFQGMSENILSRSALLRGGTCPGTNRYQLTCAPAALMMLVFSS